MPLKCLSSDGPIFALDYTREDFEQLRLKHNSQRHLSFKCCSGQVGLRVSSTGFQHFYHVKRGGCSYEGETLEHLQAKAVIVQAARGVGWHAETEFDDEQGRWRADVLLTKGAVRLAFEVQWSSQTWAETLLRQQRYADCKVRGLWLLRRPTYEPSEKAPAFQLRPSSTRSGFEVLISPPKEKWVPSTLGDAWLDLAIFVHCALHRELKFGAAASARRFHLHYAVHPPVRTCMCGSEVVVPYSFFATPLDLEGHRPYHWHQSQDWRSPPAWMNVFSRYCNDTTSRLKLAYAKAAGGWPPLIWICPQCNATVLRHASKFGTVEVKSVVVSDLPAPTPSSPEAKFCDRWWIDPAAFVF